MADSINSSPDMQLGSTTLTPTMAARKQMTPADPNEPKKPLSAYALFFRDTMSAIKQQNPTCSFQELSKIVASMWDALDSAHKEVYNLKNETAKTEYIKQMQVYRDQQQPVVNSDGEQTSTTTAAPAADTNPQQQSTSTQQMPQTAQQPAQVPNNASAVQSGAVETAPTQKCSRDGCTNNAIVNPDWEDEYCSNECVVIHCRDVFNAWVQSNLAEDE